MLLSGEIVLVKYRLYVYKNADDALKEKGLLEEVKNVLEEIKRASHREIQAELQHKGWTVEHKIFQETTWAWDAYKGKVAVSIEFSLIDAVHRDLLRAILGHKKGDLDALVYVTSTFKEPRFQNVKRDIEIFKEILNFPILLVGLAQV